MKKTGKKNLPNIFEFRIAILREEAKRGMEEQMREVKEEFKELEKDFESLSDEEKIIIIKEFWKDYEKRFLNNIISPIIFGMNLEMN